MGNPAAFTPGWDLVGVVDRLGDDVSGIESGQIVGAMPINGAYAEFVCPPHQELIPVPPSLDAAEAVSLVLNYITAYQMLHRFSKVRPGARADSRCVRRGRHGTLAVGAPCRARDVWYLFVARRVSRFRAGRNPD